MSAQSSERDRQHNQRAIVEVGQMFGSVFTGIVEEATRSVVDGSEITGSEGQPVQTGALKASWQTVYESPSSAIIGTNVVYAPSIEDGVSYAHGGRPLTLRSEVGGFFSVRKTVAGIGAIKDAVVARVNAARGRRS